MHKSRGVYKK
jgi:hypothetical protein